MEDMLPGDFPGDAETIVRLNEFMAKESGWNASELVEILEGLPHVARVAFLPRWIAGLRKDQVPEAMMDLVADLLAFQHGSGAEMGRLLDEGYVELFSLNDRVAPRYDVQEIALQSISALGEQGQHLLIGFVKNTSRRNQNLVLRKVATSGILNDEMVLDILDKLETDKQMANLTMRLLSSGRGTTFKDQLFRHLQEKREDLSLICLPKCSKEVVKGFIERLLLDADISKGTEPGKVFETEFSTDVFRKINVTKFWDLQGDACLEMLAKHLENSRHPADFVAVYEFWSFVVRAHHMTKGKARHLWELCCKFPPYEVERCLHFNIVKELSSLHATGELQVCPPMFTLKTFPWQKKACEVLPLQDLVRLWQHFAKRDEHFHLKGVAQDAENVYRVVHMALVRKMCSNGRNFRFMQRQNVEELGKLLVCCISDLREVFESGKIRKSWTKEAPNAGALQLEPCKPHVRLSSVTEIKSEQERISRGFPLVETYAFHCLEIIFMMENFQSSQLAETVLASPLVDLAEFCLEFPVERTHEIPTAIHFGIRLARQLCLVMARFGFGKDKSFGRLADLVLKVWQETRQRSILQDGDEEVDRYKFIHHLFVALPLTTEDHLSLRKSVLNKWKEDFCAIANQILDPGTFQDRSQVTSVLKNLTQLRKTLSSKPKHERSSLALENELADHVNNLHVECLEALAEVWALHSRFSFFEGSSHLMNQDATFAFDATKMDIIAQDYSATFALHFQDLLLSNVQETLLEAKLSHARSVSVEKFLKSQSQTLFRKRPVFSMVSDYRWWSLICKCSFTSQSIDLRKHLEDLSASGPQDSASNQALQKLLTFLLSCGDVLPLEKFCPSFVNSFCEALCADTDRLLDWKFLDGSAMRGIPSGPMVESLTSRKVRTSSLRSLHLRDLLVHQMRDKISKLMPSNPSIMQAGEQWLVSLRDVASIFDRSLAKERRDLTFQADFEARRNAHLNLLLLSLRAHSEMHFARNFERLVQAIRNEQGPNLLDVLRHLESRIWPQVLENFLLTEKRLRELDNMQEFLRLHAMVDEFELDKGSMYSESILESFESLVKQSAGVINMDRAHSTAATYLLRAMIQMTQNVACLSPHGSAVGEFPTGSLRKKWFVAAGQWQFCLDKLALGERVMEDFVLGYPNGAVKHCMPSKKEVAEALKSACHEHTFENVMAHFARMQRKDENVMECFFVDSNQLMDLIFAAYDFLGIGSAFRFEEGEPLMRNSKKVERMENLVRAVGAGCVRIPGLFEAIHSLTVMSRPLHHLEQWLKLVVTIEDQFPSELVPPSIAEALESMFATIIQNAGGDNEEVTSSIAQVHREIAEEVRRMRHVSSSSLGTDVAKHFQSTKNSEALNFLRFVPHLDFRERSLKEMSRISKDIDCSMTQQILSVDRSGIHLNFVCDTIAMYRQDQLAQFVENVEPHERFRSGIWGVDESHRKMMKEITERERKEHLDATVGWRPEKSPLWVLKRFPFNVNRRLGKIFFNDYSNTKLSAHQRREALSRWLELPSLESQEIVDRLSQLYDLATREQEKMNNVSSETKGAISTIIQGVFKQHDEPRLCLAFLLSPEIIAKDSQAATSLALAGARHQLSVDVLTQTLCLALSSERRGVLRIGLHKAIIFLLASCSSEGAYEALSAEWKQENLHPDVRIEIARIALRTLGGEQNTMREEVEVKFAFDVLGSLSSGDFPLKILAVAMCARMPPVSNGQVQNKTHRLIVLSEDSKFGAPNGFYAHGLVLPNTKEIAEMDSFLRESKVVVIDKKFGERFFDNVVAPLVANEIENVNFKAIARVFAACCWTRFVPNSSFLRQLVAGVSVPCARTLEELAEITPLKANGIEIFQIQSIYKALTWFAYFREFKVGLSVAHLNEEVEGSVSTLLIEPPFRINSVLVAGTRVKIVLQSLRQFKSELQSFDLEEVNLFVNAIAGSLQKFCPTLNKVVPSDLPSPATIMSLLSSK